MTRLCEQLGCLRLMLCAALLFGCAIAFASSKASAQAQDKWHPWWELGGYYGTDDASRGEVTIFAPVAQSAASLFFADIRGKFFEQDTQEINFALGHRRMLNSGWNFGLWGGLDVRSTGEDNNTFVQVSGGLEMLSDRWDVRVNGYAPISDPKSSPSTARVFLSGNNIFMTGGEEVPLYGVDGEVGFLLFGGQRAGSTKDGPSYGRRHELRVYGGGFWFDDDEALEEVAGLKTRLEFRIEDIIAALPGSRLTLESEYSHDDVRDDKWEVGARLRIPFGSRKDRAAAYAALSAQARRMTEGIERDTDIITARSKEENVEDALTNVDFDRVAFVNNGGSVTNTSTAAGSNSLLIVNGTITGAQTVQANQTVQGGGSTINVRGLKSGTAASFTAPGARPTVSSGVNAAIVGLTGNNHVAGLNIVGGGAGGANVGILGSGSLGNIAATYNTITNTGGTGISVTNFTGPGSRNLTINHNTVSQAGADGIRAGFAGSGSGTLTLNYNTISQPALDGIQVTTFNDVTLVSEIMHNRVSNAGADGVRFDLQNDTVNRLNLAWNTIVGPASDGLEFDIENNARISGAISNNTINGTTFGEGIEIDQDQNSFASLVISGNVLDSFADPLDIDLDDNSTGFYQVVGNVFSSAQPASIIDIDTNDNAVLRAQVARNTTNVNLDFDEDGASTFRLENTIGTNTLLAGATAVIDPLIEIVPPGTFFPFP